MLLVKDEEWELAGGWVSSAIAQGPCLINHDYTGLAFGWTRGRLNKAAGLAGVQIGSKARGFQQR